jgi:hypothetical protein
MNGFFFDFFVLTYRPYYPLDNKFLDEALSFFLDFFF